MNGIKKSGPLPCRYALDFCSVVIYLEMALDLCCSSKIPLRNAIRAFVPYICIIVEVPIAIIGGQ